MPVFPAHVVCGDENNTISMIEIWKGKGGAYYIGDETF